MAQIKRILVTGGAGFLGSHLCERLVEQGHDVICLDNFFTSQKTNVAHLLDRPNFELIRHDVTQPILLEVDEIYNLACPAAPGHYQYNPIKTMKTSVLGAINMLGMAKRCRAKILQASTSEVYGDPEVHPQPEDYRGAVNPIGPRACYDEGKRAAETLFMDYHRMHNASTSASCGSSTPTARGCTRSTAAWCRTSSARRSRGEDITIFGDGSQTRSFCYRDDLIEGMIRMMNGPDDFIGPVNLGNPGEFTILELAEHGDRADRQQSRRSSTSRCRTTIRRSGSRISRWPRRSSAGSRRFRSAKGSKRRSPGSARSRWDEYRAPTPNY